MILDSEVQIRVNNRTAGIYKNKGYEIPMRMGSKGYMVYDTSKYFTVDIKDVDRNSTVLVNTSCDICGDTKIMPYREYYRQLDENGIRTCVKCKSIKSEATNIERYGVPNPSMAKSVQEKISSTIKERYGVEWAMQSKDTQEKRKNTFLEKYGCEWATQNEEVKQRTKETNMERYGQESPMQTDDVKSRLYNSLLEKYGTTNPMYVPEIRRKIERTNIEKYGCISPFGSNDVINKSLNSKFKNESVPTSKQQKYLAKLYCGQMNVPCSKYSLDIVVDNMDIEYDGKGHDLSVVLNNISEKDFYIKEIIRDKTVKSLGFKIVRLISKTDKLPSDDILLQLLEISREYFSSTNHTWIEWIFDENKYRNAENKDGVYFDFGILKSVKKSA